MPEPPATVVGVFRDRARAERAYGTLTEAGFAPEHTSILVPGPAEDHHPPEASADTAGARAVGATLGATAGGLLGGTAGALAGLGALVIPGLGPFLAAGMLIPALAGAAVGGGVGGLAGALIASGVAPEDATRYEAHVRGGASLVIVRAAARGEQARALLARSGADDVAVRTASDVHAGPARPTPPAYATDRESVGGTVAGQVPPIPAAEPEGTLGEPPERRRR